MVHDAVEVLPALSRQRIEGPNQDFVAPEDEIDVTVRAGFGRSRIQYEFGIQCRGAIAAVGAMTSVCARAEAKGQLKTIGIPTDVRERLTRALK